MGCERSRYVDGGVAVVILNWNGVDHLRRFLPSVVQHTPEWVDIVVADNGSSDTSAAVVTDFARVHFLDLGCNWGFAEGYNRAIEMVDCDIFVALNSDVEVSEGWIDPLLEEFDGAPDVAVVGSKLRSLVEPDKFEYAGASGGFIDYLGYPFCRGRVVSSVEVDDGQYDDARDLFWVSGAAFGCRRSIFRQLGGFDADFFAHMEEIDLCWRMQLAGYRVRVAPRSVVYHLGGGTLSSDSANKTMLNHRNNLAMLYKCAPTTQRVVVALLRPFLDFTAALSYLVQGRYSSFWAVFRAWAEFLRWHSKLESKRREVRSNRVGESKYIYRGSIIVAKLIGHRVKL